jgi:SAM-dependent methyltransferase
LRTAGVAAAPLRVVDFGAGSGNLSLPLAWALGERAHVTAVDCKPRSASALAARASAAGLPLDVHVGRIEDFDEPFDFACGLHVCGAGSDAALGAAARAGAAFLISPCCVGKLGGGGLIPCPRSARLRSRISDADFALLAAAADFAGGGGIDGYDSTSPRGRLPRAAKAVVEADRASAAADAGYAVRLVPLLTGSGAVGIKSDLLVGWRPGEGARAAALESLFVVPV